MLSILKSFNQVDRKECMDRIDKLNSNLYKLVNGAPQTTAVESTIPHAANVTGHYQRVRNHAMILYDALKEKLQGTSCLCKVCVHRLLFCHAKLLSIVSFANYRFLSMRRYIVLIYT